MQIFSFFPLYLADETQTTYMMKLKDINEEERPRERLFTKGAEALSNAELLAILIGSGTPEKSAVDLMKEILADCGNNLNQLGKLSLAELQRYKGVGLAKAVTIQAACEMGRRRQVSRPEERPRMDSANAIYREMHPRMQDLDVEEAWVVLANQSFRLIKVLRLSHGGISETAVDVRVALREALLCNATVMALCHNHPSGNCHPSRDDDRITDLMRKACETMRIRLVDHVIVTDGAYYSYREEGKL